MKTKELRKLIKYWPDEGEVHIEGCELDEDDIWCVATAPQWHEMHVAKYKDLTRTKNLFQECCDDLIKKEPENPMIETLKEHIIEFNEELVKLETTIRAEK